MKLLKYLVASCIALCSLNTVASEKQTIKIVSSFPVGAGPDVLSRKLGERLETVWNANIVFENRPGGIGAVALNAYQTDTNSTTLFLGSNDNYAVLPIITKSSALVDTIEPLAPMTTSNSMLFTGPAVQDYKDLLALINNKHSYGSPGVGSPFHFISLSFLDAVAKSENGTHVPYRDYGQLFTDTSNGLLTFGFATPGSSANLEKAGRLKYHAFTGNKRHPQYPQVPTVREVTGKNIDLVQPWAAFFIKKSAPVAVKQKMAADIVAVLASPEFAPTLVALNYDRWEITLPEFHRFAKNQTELYQQLVKKHNVVFN